MMSFVAFLYGLHLVFLVYLFSYLTVSATFHSRIFPFLVSMMKYVAYGAAVYFGFKVLPQMAIVVGMTVGIFLSLPLAVWVNQKMNDKASSDSRTLKKTKSKTKARAKSQVQNSTKKKTSKKKKS